MPDRPIRAHRILQMMGDNGKPTPPLPPYAERLYAALVYPMLTLRMRISLKCTPYQEHTKTGLSTYEGAICAYSNFPIGLGVLRHPLRMSASWTEEL